VNLTKQILTKQMAWRSQQACDGRKPLAPGGFYFLSTLAGIFL